MIGRLAGLLTAAALLIIVGIGPPALAQNLISSTFEFGDGRPFVGQVTLGDISVQLLTTNTEPWGATSFRDQVTGIPAEIVFCFNRPIAEFHVTFSRILAGELLRDFAQGPPTRIEGDIIDQGDGTFTVLPEVGDYGTGTLVWQNLKTQIFSFVIDNPSGWATAVDTFALAAHAGANGGTNDAAGTAPCEQVAEQLPVGY